MLRTNRLKQPARSKQRKQPERPIFPCLRPCQPLRIRRRHARRALSMHNPCWNPSYSHASRKSTDDERVVSLMHMLGWPAQFVCCSIAGAPHRETSQHVRHRFATICRRTATARRRTV